MFVSTDVDNNQWAYYVNSANNVVKLSPITGVEQIVMPTVEYVSSSFPEGSRSNLPNLPYTTAKLPFHIKYHYGL